MGRIEKDQPDTDMKDFNSRYLRYIANVKRIVNIISSIIVQRPKAA